MLLRHLKLKIWPMGIRVVVLQLIIIVKKVSLLEFRIIEVNMIRLDVEIL